MKIVTIVGARPQFIKMAPMGRALRSVGHTEIIVHTGQHYDSNMSDVFFSELGIPRPDYFLAVGSGMHGAQTGEMLKRIELVLLKEQPAWTVVYGDTNSTLAGALAAAKLSMKVAHVEAGLRSFDRRMPEEINRILVDHLADLLLCPAEKAAENLREDGVNGKIEVVGDIMTDSLAYVRERLIFDHSIVHELQLPPREYLLATVHRQENADQPAHLSALFEAFAELGCPIVFPVHPRTRKMIEANGLRVPGNVVQIDPLGYLDMVALMEYAKFILTDSGGMQKEAYWLGVPCVTLRESTEWWETLDTGWNTLVGVDRKKIVETITGFREPKDRPPLYGDRHVAERCIDALVRYC